MVWCIVCIAVCEKTLAISVSASCSATVGFWFGVKHERHTEREKAYFGFCHSKIEL